MIQVSAATLYHGRSHLNPSQRSRVTLLTRYGKELWERKAKLYTGAVKNGSLDFYKKYLYTEQQKIGQELSHFLRDEKMAKQFKMNDEDAAGWEKYRELSDEYSVITYFLKKDEKPG